MPTIKAVILNRTNKLGFTQIQVAVTNKGKTTYIPTGIKCKPSEWKNGRVKNNSPVNADLLELTNKYEAKMNNIENVVNMPVAEIKNILLNASNRNVTLLEYIDKYADTQNYASRCFYTTLSYIVSKFLVKKKLEQLRLIDLTNYHISEFCKWFSKEKTRRGKCYATDTMYLHINKLKQVLRQANREGLCASVENLFCGIKAPENKIRENNICVETFIKICNTEFSFYKGASIAKDMFILSFYLGGMNIVDILRLDFRKDVITFARQKVRESAKDNCKVTIRIFPQARIIIDKYIDNKTGKLNIGIRTNRVAQVFAKMVVEFKRMYDTNEYITFYSARKLFATLGTNLGVSDNIINYILGHSNKDRGIISHYSSILPDLAEEAMKIIFDFVSKPEDLKVIFRRNMLKQLYGV